MTAGLPTMLRGHPSAILALDLPDNVKLDKANKLRSSSKTYDIETIERTPDGRVNAVVTVTDGSLLEGRCLVDRVVGGTALGWKTASEQGGR